MNLKGLLRQPEGRMLEFRSSFPTGKQLAKTAITFANGNGGKIIIGIDGKIHKVIGIKSEDLFSLEERIPSIICWKYSRNGVF